MRIAMISDLERLPWAGCEELWAATARSALLAGHEVAFFPDRADVRREKIAPLQAMGLQFVPPAAGPRAVMRIRRKVSWKLGSALAPHFPIFREIRKFAPDVLFITAGDAVPQPAFLNHLGRSGALESPYVIVCHNSHLFSKPIQARERLEAARYYLGAKCVLFAAERTYRDTEHLLAVRLPRVRLVRNPSIIPHTVAKPAAVAGTVRIATVGRLLTHCKGQDILLAALGSKQFSGRDWRLSIYGDGPHLEYLRMLAEHYGIAPRVDFKGHTNDISQIWAEHHLHALPSRNESAPLALVEAMLCARPTIANDVGGICEWMSEPETGFVSSGLHLESFQAALDRAWEARDEWIAMGERARQKALSLLDPDPGATALDILIEATELR